MNVASRLPSSRACLQHFSYKKLAAFVQPVNNAAPGDVVYALTLPYFACYCLFLQYREDQTNASRRFVSTALIGTSAPAVA